MDASARGQLRAARTTQHLSLRELAKRVGVSASLLSQVENGKSDPSVSTLYALVAELGLSLDTLLESAEHRSTSVAAPRPPRGRSRTAPRRATADPGPVIRPRERRVLHMDSGVVWERLTRGPSDLVDALLVTYEPGGSSSSSGRLMSHSGREFAFLISGRLTVQLAFETYVIEAGDSLELESPTPHLYVNRGPEPAVGIWYVVGKEVLPTTRGRLHTMAGTGHRTAPGSTAVELLTAWEADEPPGPGRGRG
jgi:transcriptional regulator with XRE-family HTH domain/quercetin dioxygenase-like cupin family protein